jgi:RNA exonuclease 1
VYHATPISKEESEPVQEVFEEKRSKPKLEYLPLPIKQPPTTTITNYTPTAIKPKESYTPKEVVTTASSSNPLSYVPSKITEISIFNDQSEEVSEKEKSSKSSSSSRHRHSSSSSSSHKKSSSSSSRDHHKSSHKSSSHKSSRHKSSSSNQKSGSSSSSSNGHKHKKDKDKDKEKESKKRKIEEEKEAEKTELQELPEEIEDIDEDDIEQQCRMIFETYQPEEQEEVKQPTKSNKPSDEIDIYEGKKRQAHENAISVQKPPVTLRQNHAQSAILTAQRREEMAIQKALTENKARDEQIKKLEEEISKKEDEMTPLVNPLIFVRPPKRPSITPISQRMAIEAAKRKVMELNKAKDLPYRQTTAQTSSKSAGEICQLLLTFF